MDPIAQTLIDLAARIGGQCVSVAVSAVSSSAAIVVVSNGVRWIYRTVKGGGVIRERVPDGPEYSSNDHLAHGALGRSERELGVSAPRGMGIGAGRGSYPDGYQEFEGTDGMAWGGPTGTRCGFCGGKIDRAAGECLKCGMDGATWAMLDHQ